MTFYRGYMEFSDGRTYDDLWVNEDDAMNYYESAPYFEGCIRAELFEMRPDESNLMYERGRCLYEYDVNGRYYYNVEEEKTA